MKKLTLLAVLLLAAVTINAQAPKKTKADRPSGLPQVNISNHLKTAAIAEGFETFPSNMNGWTILQTNSFFTWVEDNFDPYAGSQNMICDWDDEEVSDEWLITPEFDFSNAIDVDVDFYWFGGEFAYIITPDDNCDLILYLSIDGGLTWDPIWDETTDGTSWNDDEWNYASVNVPDAIGEPSVMFAFVYEGFDGSYVGIDEVMVDTIGDNTTGKFAMSLSPIKTNVYPNPATNKVNVETTASVNEINIYNSMGQLVIKSENPSYLTSIDVSSLPEGLYNIILHTNTGQINRKLTITK